MLGYVPQEDIVHAELPLARMLRYAARLRLPSSTTAADIDDAVSDALDTVGLTAQADVRVGSLSGGQRKRASIAVELLTDPRIFFLDEPTSGLDPVTSAELVAQLRDLADRSATVVFTTHSVEDLAQCDRIVFMAPGGRVASSAPSTKRWTSSGSAHRCRSSYRASPIVDTIDERDRADRRRRRPRVPSASGRAAGRDRVHAVERAHAADAWRRWYATA